MNWILEAVRDGWRECWVDFIDVITSPVFPFFVAACALAAYLQGGS